MEAVDGNAIAGALMNYFGHEMTMAEVRCRHCKDTSVMAELVVYIKAPGAVARCPACGEVMMVIVNARETERVDMSNMDLMSGDTV